MKTFSTTQAALLTILLAALGSASALAEDQQPPEITEDGLHLVPDTDLALVYADPEADLSGYARVKLLEAEVAFKKDWLRDQRRSSISKTRISSRDVEKIKTKLAEEFRTVFTKTLSENGYEITEETGEDVLVVRPAIVNLDVNAPDVSTSARSYSMVESAGEMTLYIELFDSLTGDILAKALDRKVDNRNRGYYTWANSVTNKAAADRILKGWAEILVNALDEATENDSEEE